MIVIYVGDSKDVIRRIRDNHCGNGTNVEASALRERVAENMGYRISKTRRASGSTKKRLDLPNPQMGEQEISAYIKSGIWRFAICNSAAEAKDFQWYVIEQLKPLLNIERKPWNKQFLEGYKGLSAKLTTSPARTLNQLNAIKSGPGVYVLYHEVPPRDFITRHNTTK